MDAARVNEVLAIHAGFVTQESHLAAVSYLATWPEAEILDYQAFLTEAIVDGRFVVDTIESTIRLSNGQVVAEEELESWLRILQSMILDGYEVERNTADLALLQDWTPVPPPRHTAPDGVLCIPFQHIAMSILGYTEQAPEARRKFLNSISTARTHMITPSLNDLLREAPWAYRRKTGSPPPGAIFSLAEEYADSESAGWFSTSLVARRGGDVVELIGFCESPTPEYARQHTAENLVKLIRSLKARVISTTALTVIGGKRSEDHWGFDDGQLVAELAPAEPAEPNALLGDFRSALFVDYTSPAQHPRMPDDEFWALMNLLGADFTDDDVELLTVRIAKMAQKRIIGFSETLADKLYQLDQPQLMTAPNSTNQTTMSADVFLYFRCAVLAGGRDAFERVLSEGGIREEEWNGEMGEELLRLAPEAWERRRGEEFEHETSVSYETGSNTDAWGEPAKLPGPPIRGFSVWSGQTDEDGSSSDIVRFWNRSTADEASAAHEFAERERLGDRFQSVKGVEPLPDIKRLNYLLTFARVAYYRSRD